MKFVQEIEKLQKENEGTIILAKMEYFCSNRKRCNNFK